VVRETLVRHAPVVPMLTRGILEVREKIGVEKIPPAISHFLDRFHMSRIAIRMLLSQHSEMWVDVSASEKANSDWVGIIERNCKPAEIARDAAVNASNLCMQVYASAPQVEVIEANGAGEICFSYVPSHLYHIIFELLKVGVPGCLAGKGAEQSSG
jgi:pyruvate dehydrogenase kinase 2/3/4